MLISNLKNKKKRILEILFVIPQLGEFFSFFFQADLGQFFDHHDFPLHLKSPSWFFGLFLDLLYGLIIHPFRQFVNRFLKII